MQTSIFLARLLGPALLTLGLSILFNESYYRAMTKQFVANKPLMYVAALVGVIAGLAIVLVHNVWTTDWRVIITLLGWANLLRGIASLLLPDNISALAKDLMANKKMPMPAGIVAGLLGAILCYFGYLG